MTDGQKLAREVLAEAFGLPAPAVPVPEPLNLGMTNYKFLGRVEGQDYIIRLPGAGTQRLVDRRHEYAAYQTVLPFDICDEVVYINPESGIKITRYVESARVCDPNSPEDLKLCMARLRDLHDRNLTVEHSFEPFEWLEKYESFWGGAPSVYGDYQQVKARVLSLRPWLDPPDRPRRLCHVDAVCDNFLIYDWQGETQVKLIDWEYAGMGDPLMDLGMFAIYVSYDKARLDRLMELYDPALDGEAHRRVYGWASVCGLLWSNWCEYKFQLGVDFGDYAREQYRQAGDFWRLAVKGESL